MSSLKRSILQSLEEGHSTWKLYPNKSFLWKVGHVIYLSDTFAVVMTPYNVIRHFLNRVKRIIEWLPVLWDTHDWDHTYLTTIWAYSLKRSKIACFDKGHHIVSKGRLRDINTALALLGRLNDDNKYTEKHMEYFYQKWGESDYTFDKIEGSNYSRLRNRTVEALTEEQKKQYQKEFKRIMSLEDYLFKQDMDLLCKVLKRNLRSLWD